MKYRGSSVSFVFGSCKLIFFSLFLCLLSVSDLIAGDVSNQTVIEDLRKLTKQAEKLKRKGEFHEAEKIFRRIVERNPYDSKTKLHLAFVLNKQKRLTEAYEIAIAIAKAEPKNPYAFSVLGATMLSAGNFKEANYCFITALTLDKDDALAWAGIGTLDFYENRIEKAIDNLQLATFLDSSEPDYVFTLAQVLSRGEKYKEAAQTYEKFLQVAPQTDSDRRDRIKGLINFLKYLGNQSKLYLPRGENQTTVPVKLLRDRPVIEVKIGKNIEPLKFVLDTGSGISVISEELSQRLKIKPITKGGLARGVGGEGKFEIVYGFVSSLSVGDVKILNVPVYIRKFHSNDEQIDGYIGLGLISKFLATLDYGEKTFTLVKRPDSESNVLSGLTLPLRLTSSGYLSGEVQVEGVEAALNFIVDTGASISVISEDLANTDQILKHLSQDKMRVVGAAGVTENVSSFLLPKLTFGTHSREKIKAIALDLDVINENSGFEQAGILGGNFLKNYRVTFDFKKSLVLFEPVMQAQTPPKPE